MSHWNHYLWYVTTYSKHSHYHEMIPQCQQIHAKVQEKITRMFKHRGKRNKSEINYFSLPLQWEMKFSNFCYLFLFQFNSVLSFFCMCWPFPSFSYLSYVHCANINHFHIIKVACIPSCLLSVWYYHIVMSFFLLHIFFLYARVIFHCDRKMLV